MAESERLLGLMDDVYMVLVTVDYPGRAHRRTAADHRRIARGARANPRRRDERAGGCTVAGGDGRRQLELTDHRPERCLYHKSQTAPLSSGDVGATEQRIFDLLADPSRHTEIDGSNSVGTLKRGGGRLALGSTFVIAMHSGFIRYSTESEVVEFEEDRRLAWQTYSTVRWLARFGGGRIWRYELEPVDGGTLVRETWDVTHEAKAAARGTSTGHGSATTWSRPWKARWSASTRPPPSPVPCTTDPE